MRWYPDWPFHKSSAVYGSSCCSSESYSRCAGSGSAPARIGATACRAPASCAQTGAGVASGRDHAADVARNGRTGIIAGATGLDATMLLEGILTGLLAGSRVAIVEETFFRGLMFRAVSREAGFTTAAWATALVYAAIHFFARAKIPADEVGWDSGLRLLGGALAHFSNPLPIADSFVTLLLVGLLLAFVRHRTGAIAAGIGLHMGWVAVIKTTTGITRINEDTALSFLIGGFDGYTGWLVAGWAALLLALAWSRGWLAPGSRTTP